MKARWIFLCAVAAVVSVCVEARAQSEADTLRLGVDQAVAYALRDGVEAAIARQDVREAEALVGVARSYGLPEINALGTYTRNLKKPVIFFEIEEGKTEQFELGQDNAWLGVLELRQTIFAFGRVRSAYRSATELAAAAQLAGDDAAAAIARDVKAAYYLALLAAQQTDIARRSLEQAERNVEQISDRVEQGITPEFDRLRAEVSVASRRPFLTRAQNSERIALESLKRLVGLPLDRPLALSDSLDYRPYSETMEETVERALAARRDLAALQRRASAADFRRKAQAANSRPLLSLNGNLTWQGETSDGLWPGERESAGSAAIGLTLSWPLLDGFRNRYETRRADAAALRANLEVKQLEQIVRLEARAGWSDVTSVAEEIVAARRAEDVAREAYRIAGVRYETGVSTLLEYLDAELALIQAALTLQETLFRYNVAVAQLEYGIGEGPDLELESGE